MVILLCTGLMYRVRGFHSAKQFAHTPQQLTQCSLQSFLQKNSERAPKVHLFATLRVQDFWKILSVNLKRFKAIEIACYWQFT